MGERERSKIGGREGREDSWTRDGTREVETLEKRKSN